MSADARRPVADYPGGRAGERGSSDANAVLSLQVCTEGRLILEFAFDDLMRIKTWHFTIRQYRELIPRSILAMHVSCDITGTPPRPRASPSAR